MIPDYKIKKLFTNLKQKVLRSIQFYWSISLVITAQSQIARKTYHKDFLSCLNTSDVINYLWSKLMYMID